MEAYAKRIFLITNRNSRWGELKWNLFLYLIQIFRIEDTARRVKIERGVLCRRIIFAIQLINLDKPGGNVPRPKINSLTWEKLEIQWVDGSPR